MNGQSRSKSSSEHALRSAGLGALWAGAVATIVLMLYAGGPNRPLVLVPLFAVWDISPYVMLWFLHRLSARWAPTPRTVLYYVMIAVTIGSVGYYLYDLAHPRPAQAAFPYVIVPPVSWLFVGTVLGIAGFVAYQRKESNVTL